jgi:hypothetical protein
MDGFSGQFKEDAGHTKRGKLGPLSRFATSRRRHRLPTPALNTGSDSLSVIAFGDRICLAANPYPRRLKML